MLAVQTLQGIMCPCESLTSPVHSKGKQNRCRAQPWALSNAIAGLTPNMQNRVAKEAHPTVPTKKENYSLTV